MEVADMISFFYYPRFANIFRGFAYSRRKDVDEF
ncbi:hypothetical protein QE439_002100 [Pedobacter agri]|nr:hypothetical protein [Pedobacter agri]